jgi:AbrB family looped-hinge helix DNA binding protein
MPLATLTSKGQVTIPALVREKLGLKTGDQVNFVLTPDGGVTLTPRRTKFEDLCGILRKPGKRPVSVREMDEGIERAVAARWRRAR